MKVERSLLGRYSQRRTSSLSVTLPAKWLRQHNLKKGSTVSVHYHTVLPLVVVTPPGQLEAEAERILKDLWERS